MTEHRDEDQIQVVLSLGRQGTGKSQKLWDEYISRAPRVLSLSILPKDLARDPDVIKVLGFGRLMDTLKQAAAHPSQRWHIATALEVPDLIELFTLLCPPMGSDRKSLAEAFGGMAIASGEVYEIFPNGQTPDAIKAAPRRGRHYMLDMFFAARRPTEVAHDLTGAANHLYLFQQGDVLDLNWIAKSISPVVARRVMALGEHECIHYERLTHVATHLDANGRPLGRVKTIQAADDVQNGRPTRSLAGQKSEA